MSAAELGKRLMGEIEEERLDEVSVLTLRFVSEAEITRRLD